MSAEPKTTIEPTPQEAEFGRLMWRWIVAQGSVFFDDEASEDILPLAEAAGLCRRVIYDPAKHGEIAEAEPGCWVWFWGEEGPRAEGGAG